MEDKHHAQATLPSGQTLFTIVKEAGRNPEPVWTGVEKRQYLAPTGIQTPTEALCRIGFPCPCYPLWTFHFCALFTKILRGWGLLTDALTLLEDWPPPPPPHPQSVPDSAAQGQRPRKVTVRDITHLRGCLFWCNHRLRFRLWNPFPCIQERSSILCTNVIRFLLVAEECRCRLGEDGRLSQGTRERSWIRTEGHGCVPTPSLAMPYDSGHSMCISKCSCRLNKIWNYFKISGLKMVCTEN